MKFTQSCLMTWIPIVAAKTFRFAIIGDRGGGANPQGTFERAIEQLNWHRAQSL